MRRILMSVMSFSALLLTTLTVSAYPTYCPKAPPVDEAGFCSNFKSIAKCHCSGDGKIPQEICDKMSMEKIYSNMIHTFGSLHGACVYSKEHGIPYKAEVQECIDDWECYRKGSYRLGKCSTVWNKCE